MKLVVDTNVLLSGSAWSGTASQLVDALLACALAAAADAIVTGDNDLLALKKFEGIPIIEIREALRRLGLETK